MNCINFIININNEEFEFVSNSNGTIEIWRSYIGKGYSDNIAIKSTFTFLYGYSIPIEIKKDL